MEAIYGAIIGAVAALGGGWASFLFQAKLEREKWHRTRQDAIENELRVSLQQLTIKLATAAHSMCWLTWRASVARERLTVADIESYDRELHELLPQITGQQAMIAAINRSAFDQVTGLVDRVLSLDGRIGAAGAQYRDGMAHTGSPLAELYPEVQKLEQAIPQEVANIISLTIQPKLSAPQKSRNSADSGKSMEGKVLISSLSTPQH